MNTTITINMNNAALCTLEQQARTKFTPAPTRHPMTAETPPTDLRTLSPTSARQPRGLLHE